MSLKEIIILSFSIIYLIVNFLRVLNYRNNYKSEDSDRAYYLRSHFMVSFSESTLFLAVIILCVSFNYFTLINSWISNIFSSALVSGITFVIVLNFCFTVFKLSFKFIRDFIIDQKIGLNNLTKSIFFTDSLKVFIIQNIMLSLVVSIAITIFNYTSTNFWWVSTILIMFIQVVVFKFFSSIIIPIFHKVSSVDCGDHKDEILKLATVFNFNLSSINVINQSKRSSRANAYFVGLGKNKRIVLYDTIISLLSPKELTAIVAHEIGHNKIHQFYFDVIIEILRTGVMLFLFQKVMIDNHWVNQIGFTQNSFQASLILIFLITKPIVFIMDILKNIYTRTMEFKADAYAVKIYDGEYLKEALIKLTNKNFQFVNPIPIYEFLFYSHPTINRRLEQIKKNHD